MFPTLSPDLFQLIDPNSGLSKETFFLTVSCSNFVSGDDDVDDNPRNVDDGVDGSTVGSVAEAGSIN